MDGWLMHHGQASPDPGFHETFGDDVGNPDTGLAKYQIVPPKGRIDHLPRGSPRPEG